MINPLEIINIQYAYRLPSTSSIVTVDTTVIKLR